jgi:hypothetical protein
MPGLRRVNATHYCTAACRTKPECPTNSFKPIAALDQELVSSQNTRTVNLHMKTRVNHNQGCDALAPIWITDDLVNVSTRVLDKAWSNAPSLVHLQLYRRDNAWYIHEFGTAQKLCWKQREIGNGAQRSTIEGLARWNIILNRYAYG